MSSLPHARLWYLVGMVLTLTVIVTCLLPARDLPHVRVNDKVEHIVSYLVLALWFGGLLPVRRYAWLALALLALGGGIEIAQGAMGLGRTADWHDFYADAFGTAAGMGLCLAGLRHWVQWLEQWLQRT